ncbi:MAG TPA: penicillin acylase family protein, partial [Pilimelia sp.]|nr:penicillin acylase family protein [Pilimelia sp.]
MIRYTEYGVPHILAADHAGLGYGQGYAQARDNLCVLALTHVQAAGESARHLGPGEDGANVAADAWFHEVNSSGVVDRLLAQAAPRGPGPEVRALVEGYAGGYNRYLADVGGAAGVTDPACRGAAWVRPVSALDIWRALLAAMPATLDQMMAGSATAQPPGAARAVPVGPAVLRGLRARTGGDGGPARGSNALAVGRAGAADGVRSVHVANPHFPWHGASRFYRAHLTIPGVVDAAGAAILGAPLLVHGHNHDVAWAHTVSTAQTHGLFRLTLAADDPTSYLVDGAPEKMVRRDVRVEVRQPGGGITTVTLRRWSTRYGPVVTSFDGRAYPWTRRH